MKKNVFLLTATFIFTLNTFSQQTLDEYKMIKVPHQLSLETGYRNVFSLIDRSGVMNGNSATHGVGALFDYGWQVSGLDGKKPAVYLTVPIGYTKLFADYATSKDISMLNYGWTVRHNLNRDKRLTPFLGYGLLLNTLKIEDIAGGVMGHQTQFELGTNLNTGSRLKYFAKIQYSYTSYPSLNNAKRIHFQFIDLRIGARF